MKLNSRIYKVNFCVINPINSVFHVKAFKMKTRNCSPKLLTELSKPEIINLYQDVNKLADYVNQGVEVKFICPHIGKSFI